jgi:hypothetical protein
MLRQLCTHLLYAAFALAQIGAIFILFAMVLAIFNCGSRLSQTPPMVIEMRDRIARRKLEQLQDDKTAETARRHGRQAPAPISEPRDVTVTMV